MGLRKRASLPGRHRALCAGVSVIALAISGALSGALWPTAAHAASPLSPASLAQAAAQHLAQSLGGSQGGPLANAAAQKQIALSTANLAAAAAAFKAQQAAQFAARANSQTTATGAPLSGLILESDSDPLATGTLPISFNVKTDTATVEQFSPNIVLTWETLNLNPGETLIFDQQGNATWSVLNRIVGGSSPTQIGGSIQAPGTVLLINRNGIKFTPTAQVNVHSLVASSLDVGTSTMSVDERNSFFVNNGIASTTTSTSFSVSQDDTTVQGDVTVQAGANITTSLLPSSVSPDSGGFVYLFAPNVSNAGTINTPAGQTMLVAAQQLTLTPGTYAAGGSVATNSPFRATGISFPTGDVPGQGTVALPWLLTGSGQISAPGTVSNTGLITAAAGVVVLNGDLVTQGGVIQANTSITRNGEIYLDARLQLTLASGSSTQILPDEDGGTIPLSAVSQFTPGQIELSGNVVDFAPNSMVIAPGGAVSVTSLLPGSQTTGYPTAILTQIRNTSQNLPPTIYMDADSTIDVSGLDDVLLPMSDNFVSFEPFGNEFADQPLQRNGALRGQEITVDIRQSGTLDGVAWLGTPLADVSSLIANVPQGIDQLLTTGGTVRFASTNKAQSEIITRQSSLINVAGGYVQYQGGVVATTNLLTSTGQIVNIAAASPLGDYLGIAGVTTVEDPHWGASTAETFTNPLLAGGQYEAGYIVGRDAGGITLNATGYALDGSFSAGVIVGQQQRTLGKLPSAATANTVLSDPTAMPSAGYFSITGLNNFVLEGQTEYQPLPSGFVLGDPLAGAGGVDRVANTYVSADTLSQADFSKVSVAFSGALQVTGAASLTVNPGGSISLAGGSVDIQGRLTAQAGNISAEATAQVAGDVPGSGSSGYKPTSATPPDIFNLTIGANAVLDASGQWVNDTGAGAQNLVGGAYVNGGSISLKTDAQSAAFGVGSYVDLTGNIIIAAGSQLNVSSGGRLTANGQFQLDSFGRPVGNGGNVTLETYAGSFSAINTPTAPTTTTPDANIIFQASDGSADGTVKAISASISAFGFAQGGTFTLQAPSIQIGGTAPSDPGIFYLPANFFSGNGAASRDPLVSAGSAFSNFKFTSVIGTIGSAPGSEGIGIAVMPGTTVSLQQQNLLGGNGDPTILANLPTGANVSAAVAADSLIAVQQNEALRSAVSLQLSASLPAAPYPFNAATADDPTSPQVALLIGQGAAILGDAGAGVNLATIGLTVAGRSSVTAGTGQQPIGLIAAQTAVADVEGLISAPGGNIVLSDITGAAGAEFYLGTQSELDVKGLVVTDLRQTLFSTGQVLSGGTISVKLASQGSVLVGMPGAVMDVSGTTGTFDLPEDGAGGGLPGIQRVPTTVWSDAGAITLSAPTLLYDGSFSAAPGAGPGGSGSGGSLTITTPQAATLTVQQNGPTLPANLAPTDTLPTSLAGNIIFQADLLSGSGIANLALSSGLILGDSSQSNATAYAPGTIAFNGNVTLAGLQNLTLDASTLQLDNNSSTVNLAATYVALRGAGTATPTSGAGAGTLNVNAQLVDIAASGSLGLSNVANANFTSTGDIRLRVPMASVNNDLAPGSLPFGELVTAGNLIFTATQIYPISDVDVTLKSIGSNGTIEFFNNGPAAAAPLSAGGQVTVSAANIVQDGTLLAPLGVIRLGAQTAADLSPNDPAQQNPTTQNFVATQTLSLQSGSVTSVSLSGLTVPFGETSDGTNWHYDNIEGTPITAPPAKDIAISGGVVNITSGARLDLSGGGDIQAEEFVAGTGGTRDVLANTNTSSNANVFAIIPGYNPVAAPIDFDFLQAQNDALPAAGASVILSGGEGLAAGTYTLLPALYATLPGAYRISVVANSTDVVASQNVLLPDGTLQMAGRFANPAAGSSSARSIAFDVQSAAVWRQYSEIDKTSGNSYFAGQTLASTGAPPPLPRDAGHLSVNIGLSTGSAVNLAGLNVLPGAGGSGAEVDIAAQDIQILSGAASAGAGYLALDAGQLSAGGFDSLLIGGIRSDSASGETITAVSNSVVLSNDANTPLTAAEVILVTQANPKSTDPNAARGLAIDAGAAITASGTLAASDPTTVTIGNASASPEVSGTGALLAVSSGAALAVQRQDATGTSGLITVALGAALTGNGLTLDTTGNIQVAAGATLTAADISIGSRSINFGPAPKNTTGLVVSGDLLAQLELAQDLTLRSAGAINFFGNTTIALAGAGSELTVDASSLVAKKNAVVAISAAAFDWENAGNAGNAGVAGSSSLTVDAKTIVLGAGGKALSGFAGAQFVGTQEIAVRDTGSLAAGAAGLTFDTPFFLVGAGAQQTITTSAAVTLKNSSGVAGAPSNAAEIGGTFEIDAGSISDSTLLQATAGGVTLHASTGNITLASTAAIVATGFMQTFFDTTKSAGGGTVQLIADQGGIEIDSGAAINVASALTQPGNAGSITLSAGNGTLSSGPGVAFDASTLQGNVAGDGGGSLTVNTQSMGTTLLSVPTIFSNSVDIEVHQGGLELAAGTSIASQNVTLTADAGNLEIDGTINASGTSGGNISLYGPSVTIGSSAVLLAQASGAGQNGGTIIIGAESGGIQFAAGQSQAVIDVAGGANGAGGTLRLRAPIIADSNGQNDIYNSSNVDVAIGPVNASITGARNVTIEAYQVFTPQNTGGAFNGTIDPLNNTAFFGSLNATTGLWQGDLVQFVQGFSLADQGNFAAINQSILHYQPGIELDNPNGNITVASNWNLAAGTYNPTTSTITSMAYRVGGTATGEAGALTLRASGDLVIDADISDGFFQTQNRLDPTYVAAMNAWISKVEALGASPDSADNAGDYISDVGGYILAGALYPDAPPVTGKAKPIGPPPVAPYDPSANLISPVASATDQAPIAGADLMPLVTSSGQVSGTLAMTSWSYNLVGGADLTSANPLAVRPLATLVAGNTGNVIIDGHTTVKSAGSATAQIPTIVRTGTGSINIAAGVNFELADTTAPGVVYTAGESSVAPANAGFTLQTLANPLPGAPANIQVPVASDPSGFLTPQILSCLTNNGCDLEGVITAAAYPVNGGNLTITAQQDILGFQHQDSQFYAPWLLAQGTSLSGAPDGIFSPLSAYAVTGTIFTPSQTSWWINFGSFDQGVMSVGGNVRIQAGRDISQLSVSLPTTARFSGGLSDTLTAANGDVLANIPSLELDPSGNLTVIAGRNLLSGAYYEGSGSAQISVGGSVAPNWASTDTGPPNPSAAGTTLKNEVSTVLAVDTGTIALSARGSLNLGGVVSAIALENVADPLANSNAGGNSAAFHAAISDPDANFAFLSSYGPNSAVSLQSISGTVTTNSLFQADALVENSVFGTATNPNNVDVQAAFAKGFAGVSSYPASFSAVALLGDVQVAASLQLAPSNTGNLDLLAQGSIRTYSYGGPGLLGTGPSIVEAAFDPLRPLAGFGPSFGSSIADLGPELLHQGDQAPDLFYAVSGDIVSGFGVAGSSPLDSTAQALGWQITKTAVVHAGRDVVDLPFFGQNLAVSDVTQIIAGRDIFYTGELQQDNFQILGVSPKNPENVDGLSLAGPGFFDVEAGRNLGPFVTAAADTADQLNDDKNAVVTDAVGTGIITFGNAVTVGNQTINSQQGLNAASLGPFAIGTDSQLPHQSADIVAMFGVAKGVDYQAVINNYIDPARTPSVTLAQSYAPELVTFLQTLGFSPQSETAAFAIFLTLPAALQHVFVDQVFFSELQRAEQVQLSGGSTAVLSPFVNQPFGVGYSIIAVMFPTSLGYTNNVTVGNVAAQRVETGDLEMLHATIKSLQSETTTSTNADGSTSTTVSGGDIFLLGPGGNIDVGSQATEVNTHLKASALGILTLDGGTIDTFTDGDVLVNESRILTTEGGNILMWTSNGNLDAGRGAKTTVDFQPLTVEFNPQDLQTIDLSGLVTGAGIGTIQATPDAPRAEATLEAPRGTVNIGDAGVRTSGALTIAALHVLNAGNISSLGPVTGVPQTNSVNLGSLEAAGNSAGQSANAAEQAVSAATRSNQVAAPQSHTVITVEVLGFGDDFCRQDAAACAN